MNPFLFLWRHRQLIIHTTQSDIRARYTGSMLGLTWAILNPLLLLSVYVLIYVAILKVRVPSGQGSAFEYTLIIFAGLIPWFGFSEATAASVNSIVANSGLLHNTGFPAAVLPIKAVLSSMLSQAVGLALLILCLLSVSHANVYWFFLPAAVAVQLMWSFGLGWILAVLNVFVRDLGQAISTVLLFLMLVSPIAYTEDFVTQEPLKFALLYLNPISYLIALYRVPLIFGQPPPALALGVASAVALLLFWGGFRFFVRIRPYLPDHV
jgi:lipopolysaccharide transport system permease protein